MKSKMSSLKIFLVCLFMGMFSISFAGPSKTLTPEEMYKIPGYEKNKDGRRKFYDTAERGNKNKMMYEMYAHSGIVMLHDENGKMHDIIEKDGKIMMEHEDGTMHEMMEMGNGMMKDKNMGSGMMKDENYKNMKDKNYKKKYKKY